MIQQLDEKDDILVAHCYKSNIHIPEEMTTQK